MLVKIKPLSFNEAYMGKKTKTNNYRIYEKELFYTLPSNLEIPEGKLQIYYEFGFSSRGADYDNGIKAFQDVLQMKYNFNDNKIYRAVIEKKIVKKGDEYIIFKIDKYE